MLLPSLVMGEKKYTLDRKQLFNYRGETMAEVCHIPPIAIAKTINDQRGRYVSLPVSTLISIIKNAGKLLISETLDGESFENYVEKYTYSTGLPSEVAKRGLTDLGKYMGEIDRILEREIPEHCIESLDSGIITSPYGKLAISPLGKLLGVIAPSNHPLINISWITALAMKYSVVIKPGRDDPFTPNRVINALLESGLDKALVSMLNTEQANTAKLIDGCDKVIFYGNQKSIDLFHSDKIISRGSGNSKLFIAMDGAEPDEKSLDIALNSVIHDGGRRCTNASSIVISGDAEKFAYRLAEKMIYELKEPIFENSVLGCFKSLDTAREIDEYITENLRTDRDISAEIRKAPRLQQIAGLTYLSPAVILCRDESSVLYGKELPFPFVTIAKAGKNLMGQLSNSLAVSLINADEDMVRSCVNEPTIGKVILNMPTYYANVGDPHDGFLFDSLYRVKSYIGG